MKRERLYAPGEVYDKKTKLVINAIKVDIVAFNKLRKPVIHNYRPIELLRLVHPLYRQTHARALFELGKITDSELKSLTGKVEFLNLE